MSNKMHCSDAVSELGGWDKGVLVNPIPSRGPNYTHRIIGFPPGLENLTVSLRCIAVHKITQTRTVEITS